MNIKVVLLTGDAKAAAEDVADQLGVIQVYSGLLPEQKTAFISEKWPNSGYAGRRYQ